MILERQWRAAENRDYYFLSETKKENCVTLQVVVRYNYAIRRVFVF